MEGTDIYQYKDGLKVDHTYYGNGCPGAWKNEPPYYGGSTTTCSLRTLDTYDNETLKIGTYYTYQAATDGSGNKTNANRLINPDSFCPLGWQMPYGGTGGDYDNQPKSWLYLFETYGYESMTIEQEYAKTASYPFSYIKSGTMAFSLGVLMQSNTTGHYWSNASDISLGWRLHFMSGNVRGKLEKLDQPSAISIRCN